MSYLLTDHVQVAWFWMEIISAESEGGGAQ
jgi:hypothetical protein